MRALNNLFGARACTEEALDEALQTLAFEAQFADNELVPAAPFDASLHMDARGNYSEQLLAMFLQRQGDYALEFTALTPQTIVLLQTNVFHGALINLPGHWTALRWIDSAWLYYDSFNEGPLVWTTDEVTELTRRADVRVLPLRLRNE